MQSTPVVLPRRPKECLAAVGGFVAVGTGLSLVYSFTGLGMPCPFRMLTGWSCPFCGGTRMGSALLHGDLVAAWHFNAVLLVFGVLLAVRTVGWIIEWLRHPGRGNRWLPQAVSQYWWVFAGVIAVAWVFVRNLI
ncbi:MAG: DUF2752 domain-containing protein [Propionibacteriaceae bacterium]|nr:DUF2752 domain-containing protein [Propionibacteriaceae bacterium]